MLHKFSFSGVFNLVWELLVLFKTLIKFTEHYSTYLMLTLKTNKNKLLLVLVVIQIDFRSNNRHQWYHQDRFETDISYLMIS